MCKQIVKRGRCLPIDRFHFLSNASREIERLRRHARRCVGASVRRCVGASGVAVRAPTFQELPAWAAAGAVREALRRVSGFVPNAEMLVTWTLPLSTCTTCPTGARRWSASRARQGAASPSVKFTAEWAKIQLACPILPGPLSCPWSSWKIQSAKSCVTQRESRAPFCGADLDSSQAVTQPRRIAAISLAQRWWPSLQKRSSCAHVGCCIGCVSWESPGQTAYRVAKEVFWAKGFALVDEVSCLSAPHS